MAASPPPLPLRVLVFASLALCVLPLGFSFHYTKGWAQARAGKSIPEQRESLKGVTWFKRPFTQFVERLKRTLPPDAKVLVEPSKIETGRGNARWFLFLNYYAYPIEFYVRKPAQASGTLVDYPQWLRYHREPARDAAARDLRLKEQLGLNERGVDWKLRYVVADPFDPRRAELFEKVNGRWVPRELWTPPEGVVVPEEPDDETGADEEDAEGENG